MAAEEFNALEAAKQLLNATSNREHLKTALLASVELVPMIGGALSTLLSEYLPNWKFQEVTQFLESCAEDVDQFKDKVDQAVASTTEYGLLFEHVLQQESRTP